MSSATEQPDPGVRPEVLGDEPVRRRRDEPEPEWMDVHEPRPPWQVPRWLWWLVAVTLVVGSVAWYADHQARTRESAAVAGCEHRLSNASALSEIRMGAMNNYLRPALASTRGARQLHLADLMSGPARTVLPGVQRADRVCNAGLGQALALLTGGAAQRRDGVLRRAPHAPPGGRLPGPCLLPPGPRTRPAARGGRRSLRAGLTGIHHGAGCRSGRLSWGPHPLRPRLGAVVLSRPHPRCPWSCPPCPRSCSATAPSPSPWPTRPASASST